MSQVPLSCAQWQTHSDWWQHAGILFAFKIRQQLLANLQESFSEWLQSAQVQSPDYYCLQKGYLWSGKTSKQRAIKSACKRAITLNVWTTI